MDIQEQLKKGKESVALRVTNCVVEGEYPRAELLMQVVYIDDTEKYGFSFYANWYEHKRQYKGLQVAATQTRETFRCYEPAINPRYGEVTTLDKAVEAVKVLKPIHKKMVKYADQEGWEQSLPEFAVRFARAIGAKKFIDGDHIRPIGHLRDHLEVLQKQNAKALNPSD